MKKILFVLGTRLSIVQVGVCLLLAGYMLPMQGGASLLGIGCVLAAVVFACDAAMFSMKSYKLWDPMDGLCITR